MSWREQLAILKMAGWQLKHGMKYWYMFRPDGDYFEKDTAKTYLIRYAFREHMYHTQRAEQ